MDVTSSNMKYKHIICVGGKKGPRLQALFWAFCCPAYFLVH